MRRAQLVIAALLVVLASVTLIRPTGASSSNQLAAIADYLHQVIDASPPVSGALQADVDRLDRATATPTCTSLVPPVRRLRPGLDRVLGATAVTDRVAVDPRIQLVGQLVTYGDQILARCA